MKILDCTLRDGGYYTNWDFDDSLVKTYFRNMNLLPLEYLEAGYRSPKKNGYQGEFFYCSEFTMKRIKDLSGKKLAIIIDEKSVDLSHIEELLKPCLGYVDLIRIAVKPDNVFKALQLAEKIKKMSFKVAFNVMYLSEWHKYKEIKEVLSKLNNLVDYFYMVDSFGSVFPEDIKNTIEEIRAYSDISLGFHGHNNIELGLINTLTAIENGVEIIDSTVTGMGRGAGNLKTELLLSVLNKRASLDVNFDALSDVTTAFEELRSNHQWGTSLPYMVSGVRSLPQKEVMEWVSKKYYSLNSVIRALNTQSNLEKHTQFPEFKKVNKCKKILIIGGGPSVIKHQEAIKELLMADSDMSLIHASSKNALPFKDVENKQYFCLVGNEGVRMSKVFEDLDGFSGNCILPPSPRKMGTFVPEKIIQNTFELSKVDFTSLSNDAHTTIAIQTAIDLDAEEIYFTGFDGYLESEMAQKDHELFFENSKLFEDLEKQKVEFCAITPTNYKTLPQSSIYKLIHN
ncbi:aldolase catalytic domain-containing protein [Polaribacter gochangensis]|uniref:aldolase catalytic domain-containing protein n=1 Tax=Polaribacter gochangensis TaxID=3252903 RepID=UPI003904BC52